jgi:hypothetical protein
LVGVQASHIDVEIGAEFGDRKTRKSAAWLRRCTGLNTNEAARQLLEERQDVASLQLTPDDHIALCANAVDLKDRLRNIETNRRDRGHD